MCDYCENGKNIELTSDSAKSYWLFLGEGTKQGYIAKWEKAKPGTHMG